MLDGAISLVTQENVYKNSSCMARWLGRLMKGKNQDENLANKHY